MSLSLDRKAFIDILTEGQGDIGGVMQPPPEGLWGMPPELLANAAGLRSRRARRTAPRRARMMEKLGYGPDKRLAVTVSTRNIAALPRSGGDPDRPAEGDLYRRRCSNRSTPPTGIPKLMRKDYTVGVNVTETACRRSRIQRSTKITSAARSATTPATATRRSTSWSMQQSAESDHREAQAAGVGDRKEAGRGRRAADPLLQPRARPAGTRTSRG